MVPTENLFLHAGYISSMPRSFYLPHYLDVEKTDKVVEPPLNLDVSKSLQLVGDSTEPVTKAAIAHPPNNRTQAAVNNLAEMASGLTLFFCCAGLLHYLRRYSQRLAFVLLIVLLLSSFIGMNAYSKNNRKINEFVSYSAHPGISGRALYKNPHAATLVIMHGLLVDGVINSNGVITSLDRIQKEVAFPTMQLTDGMKHALDNYAFDGWGRPFALSTVDEHHYQIMSLGHDGKPNTKDDITIRFERGDEGNWDGTRWGLFAQKEGNDLRVYFHRWPGELFNFQNRDLAMLKSGSSLFDVWMSEQTSSDSMERVKKSSQWGMVPTMKEGELYLWVSAWKMSKR